MNKKALLIGGCALAVVAIVVALIFIFTGGGDAYRSIKVFEIDGSCKVDRGGDSLDAFKNMALSSGDSLTVGEGSFARLKLDDDKYVYLEANTKINLTATGTANDSKTMVYIERGSMLTEVKKKLSATSSYDIVTPNTTMSIRGTKTLTQVLEDAVTGHVQTSNAVLEGQVKIKAVKVKADGTVVSVEKDLGAGEGNAFKSAKEELVSQEEMQAIAETGASVNGIKVEIVSEEDADVVFDVATFEASFLENVKNILVADAQAETGEEGLSQEQIDAINAQLGEVLESFDVISTESQNAINAAASGEIEPEPTPEITPEPTPEATSDSLWSWENIAVTETEDTQDEGTTLIEGDTNLLVIDDTDEADDTADRDNGADEVGTEDDDNDDAADEDGEEADETDEDEVSDEDDNAGEDDVDDADDADDEDKSDEEGEEENTDEEDADKEDGEEEEAEDEEEQSEEKSESDSDAQNSESTDTPNTSTTDPNTSGTSTGTQTNEPTPVTYSYSRSFSTSSQGSASEQDTVSLVFKQGNEVVSADMLPSSYAANAPLPGSSGSNYSVSIDSDHAAEYQFTGWYVTEQLAQEADPAKSVANMPSSSSSNVPLYAGIRKIPVKITITNMYPHAGRFYAPERDPEGHEYTLTGESEQFPNLLTITGYEYGDEFALPEEGYNALTEYGADLSVTPYVGGFTESYIYNSNQTTDSPYYPLNILDDGRTDILFVGYSTVSNVDLMESGGFTNILTSYENLQQYHPIENGVEGRMYYNYNLGDYLSAFGESGAGVNQRISLNAEALDYNEHENNYELKLYAYFGTFVEINYNNYYADKMLIKTSDGYKKLSELTSSEDISVVENSGSDVRTRIWRIENNTLTTISQGSSSVVLPEIKLDTSSLSSDKYAVRLYDRVSPDSFSYINNGSIKIDETFFENGPAISAEFNANVTKYVVLDLNIDLTVNHFGDMNRYYIKEPGDSSDKKYKMAVAEYEWCTNYFDPFVREVPTYDTRSLEDDYTLVGAPSERDAFVTDPASNNTLIRNYVLVPDDAYYPWGMKGEGRLSESMINSINQENFASYAGQEAYKEFSNVGDPFGKLYGYNITYGSGSNTKSVNALYSEQNRGVPNDYTIIVKNQETQPKSVGVLLSIGLDGELFDSAEAGQIVLTPLMGPHKQPFWFSLIYDYEGYKRGDYSYAVYPENIADGYKLRITLSSPGNIGTLGIGNGDLKCEWLKSTTGYTEGPIDLSKISWEWKVANDFSAENYKARYMVGNSLYEVTPVEDNTGFLNYDIPLKHLLNDWDDYQLNFVRGLVPSSSGVNFTNVFMKQNQSVAGTPYSGDNLSLIPVNGNYVPCAFDVRVSESEVCKFTGFVGVVGEGGSTLRRVVQESDSTNCEFEEYTVVDDLEFQTGTGIYFGSYGPDWGAYVYSSWGDNAAKLYGYYSEGSIVPISYSKLLTYNTEGNIYNALHGEDNKRYGGVLISLDTPKYVKFANENVSSIILYSYNDGILSVATNTEFMEEDHKYYIGVVDSAHTNQTMLKLDGKLYMRILREYTYDTSYLTDNTSYLVEITEDGAGGSAVISEFSIQ